MKPHSFGIGKISKYISQVDIELCPTGLQTQVFNKEGLFLSFDRFESQVLKLPNTLGKNLFPILQKRSKGRQKQ